jgi:hypothetical protein
MIWTIVVRSVAACLCLWRISRHVLTTKNCKKVPINFVMFCSCVTIQEPLSWNFIMGRFDKICWHIPIWVKIRQQQWVFYIKTHTHICAGKWLGEESPARTMWGIPDDDIHNPVSHSHVQPCVESHIDVTHVICKCQRSIPMNMPECLHYTYIS